MTGAAGAQRLALPAAGGTRLAHETDKTQSCEKAQFDGVNPAVRVHAVLGGNGYQAGLTQDQVSECDAAQLLAARLDPREPASLDTRRK